MMRLFSFNEMYLIAGIACALIVCHGTSVHAVCNQTRNGRVAGGGDMDISDVPYVAAIFRYAGGAIVSENFVVTSAERVWGLDITTLPYVRVGSSCLSEGGTTHKLKQIIFHPLLNMSSSADRSQQGYNIAILELDDPIQFGPFAKAVALADEEPAAGETARLSGWGGIMDDPNSNAEQLQSAVFPVWSKQDCENAYLTVYPPPKVAPTQFCAGAPGKGGCGWDGGDPLVVNRKLVGLRVWGFECPSVSDNYYPGMYTSIADTEIRGFIRDVTGM